MKTMLSLLRYGIISPEQIRKIPDGKMVFGEKWKKIYLTD